MSDDRAETNAPDPAQLQAAIAAVTAQLASLNAQVAALTGAAPGASAEVASAEGAAASGASAVIAPGSADDVPATAPPEPAAGFVLAASDAAPLQEPAIPASSWATAAVPPPPVPVAVLPGAPYPAPMAYPPLGAVPRPVAQEPAPAGSWTNTAGIKILGWVGGGVTLLGIMLLLVVAIQKDLIGPTARVVIGAVLGLLLIGGGLLLRRVEKQPMLAAILVCIGLAVEYVTVVSAVAGLEIMPAAAGHVCSILIVAVAVIVAAAWKRPWLAAVAFVISAGLAPFIGSGLSADVWIAEAVLVLGGAACLFTALGSLPWRSVGIATSAVLVLSLGVEQLSDAGLVTVIALTLVTWGMFIVRWVQERVPVDPGPFAIRPRSYDPDQIARDYADFHAHRAAVDAARSDRHVAVASLAISAGMLVLALSVAHLYELVNVPIGSAAAVFTVIFLLLATVAARLPQLRTHGFRVVAWSAAFACAVVALLRLLEGDLRSVAWIVLAIMALLGVGAERMRSLLVVTLVGSAVALLAAGPVLSARDLFDWPTPGLLAGPALLPRAWSAVLPAGLCVLVLCAVAAWAVSRCTEVEPAVTQPAPGVAARQMTEQRRTVFMGWTLVGCSIVACYGLLAITMVLTYAIEPSFTGYQAGQIVVTVLFTVVALGLLWLGFRRIVLRIGGLVLAAVAVAKLLLFDTSSLDALPRAITVLCVGVLLLIAAVGYVMALSRQNAASPEPARPETRPV